MRQNDYHPFVGRLLGIGRGLAPLETYRSSANITSCLSSAFRCLRGPTWVKAGLTTLQEGGRRSCPKEDVEDALIRIVGFVTGIFGDRYFS